MFSESFRHYRTEWRTPFARNFPMVESSIVYWISQKLTQSPLYVSISRSRNEMTHGIWPNPISNPIYGNPCFDIFKGRQDLRYTPIQFLTPILRLAFISISSFWKSGPNWYVFQYRVGLGRVLRKSQQEGSGRIEVLKYLIRYFRVPYFLSVFFGCVWCFQVFRILRVHAIFRVDPKC